MLDTLNSSDSTARSSSSSHPSASALSSSSPSSTFCVDTVESGVAVAWSAGVSPGELSLSMAAVEKDEAVTGEVAEGGEADDDGGVGEI